jgi:hypothetical protein
LTWRQDGCGFDELIKVTTKANLKPPQSAMQPAPPSGGAFAPLKSSVQTISTQSKHKPKTNPKRRKLPKNISK